MKTLTTLAHFSRGQWDNTVTVEINDYNDIETAHICVKSIGSIYSTYTTIHFNGSIWYGAFDTYNILPDGIKKYIEKSAEKWINTAMKYI